MAGSAAQSYPSSVYPDDRPCDHGVLGGLAVGGDAVVTKRSITGLHTAVARRDVVYPIGTAVRPHAHPEATGAGLDQPRDVSMDRLVHNQMAHLHKDHPDVDVPAGLLDELVTEELEMRQAEEVCDSLGGNAMSAVRAPTEGSSQGTTMLWHAAGCCRDRFALHLLDVDGPAGGHACPPAAGVGVRRSWQFPLPSQTGGPVRQLATARTPDNCLGAIRTNQRCFFFACPWAAADPDQPHDDRPELRWMAKVATSRPLTGLAFNDVMRGEVAISTAGAGLLCWAPDTDTQTVLMEVPETDLSYSRPEWSTCYFSSHPRVVALWTSQGCGLVDLRSRRPERRGLFSLVSSPSFHFAEAVVAAQANPAFPQHLTFATTKSIAVVDERYAKRPVLSWLHHSAHPPTIFSVAGIQNGAEPQSAVVLATAPRLHTSTAFQYTRAAVPDGVGPFQTSSPQAWASLASSGVRHHVTRESARRRLEEPWNGQAIVGPSPHNPSAQIVGNALGDMFVQSIGLHRDAEGAQSASAAPLWKAWHDAAVQCEAQPAPQPRVAPAHTAHDIRAQLSGFLKEASEVRGAMQGLSEQLRPKEACGPPRHGLDEILLSTVEARPQTPLQALHSLRGSDFSLLECAGALAETQSVQYTKAPEHAAWGTLFKPTDAFLGAATKDQPGDSHSGQLETETQVGDAASEEGKLPAGNNEQASLGGAAEEAGEETTQATVTEGTAAQQSTSVDPDEAADPTNAPDAEELSAALREPIQVSGPVRVEGKRRKKGKVVKIIPPLDTAALASRLQALWDTGRADEEAAAAEEETQRQGTPGSGPRLRGAPALPRVRAMRAGRSPRGGSGTATPSVALSRSPGRVRSSLSFEAPRTRTSTKRRRTGRSGFG